MKPMVIELVEADHGPHGIMVQAAIGCDPVAAAMFDHCTGGRYAVRPDDFKETVEPLLRAHPVVTEIHVERLKG